MLLGVSGDATDTAVFLSAGQHWGSSQVELGPPGWSERERCARRSVPGEGLWGQSCFPRSCPPLAQRMVDNSALVWKGCGKKGSGGCGGRTPMGRRHVHCTRDTNVPLERGLFVVGERGRNQEAERRCDLLYRCRFWSFLYSSLRIATRLQPQKSILTPPNYGMLHTVHKL